MTSLPEVLADWTEVDEAIHAVGEALGVIDPSVHPIKAFYWTNNELVHACYQSLRLLEEAGLVESRDGPGDTEYRWCGVPADLRYLLGLDGPT